MTGRSKSKVGFLTTVTIFILLTSTLPMNNIQFNESTFENQGIKSQKASLFEQQNGSGHDLSGDLLTVDGLIDALVLEESALDSWKHLDILTSAGNQSLSFNYYLHPSESIHYCWTQSNGSVYYASQSPQGAVSILHVDQTASYAENQTPVRCAISLTETDLPRIMYGDGDDVKIARYSTSDDFLAWNLSHFWHKRTILENVHPVGFEMTMSEFGTMWAVMLTESGALKQVNFSKAFWTTKTLDSGPVGSEVELLKDVDGVYHILYSRTDVGEIRLLRIDGDESSVQVVSRDPTNLEYIGMGLDSNNIEQLATTSTTTDGYKIQLLRSLFGQRQGRLSPQAVDTISSVDDSLTTHFSFGDINGDGFDDMLLSMPEADGGSISSVGSIQIFHGSVNGFESLPNVTLTGTIENQMFGYTSLLNDFNSDGFDDALVSSPNGQGFVSIFFGSADGLNQTAEFSLNGVENESFGSDIAVMETNSNTKFLAIVSKDAQTEITTNITVQGKVSVFKFEAGEFSLHREITQTGNGPQFGRNIEACDYNGDGFDDLIVSNSPSLTSINGYSSVEYFDGSSSGIDGSPEHILESLVQGKLFAYSVKCLGDINDDGLEDHMITEPYNQTGAYNAGKLWLFFGNQNQYSSTPDWTYVSDVANSQIGRQIMPIGDVDDDGHNDLLISQYSSPSSGRIEIFFGNGNGYESESELFIQGQASDQSGFYLGGNFDFDRDGLWEVAYGKISNDGSNDKVDVIIHSKREWEVASFDFTGTLQSIELGTSSRAETTMIHQHTDGTSSTISQLEHIGDGTSSGQWISQNLLSNLETNSVSSFTVTPSGRPMLLLSQNSTTLQLHTCEGSTALHKDILTSGTMGQYLGSHIDGEDEQHLAFTSGTGNQIFYTYENQGAWSSEMVASSKVLSSSIQVHTSSTYQPYLVYRDSSSMDIEVATKVSSSWNFDALSPTHDVTSTHFASAMLANDSLVVAALVNDGTTTNLTIWDWNETSVSSRSLAVLQDNSAKIELSISSNQTIYVSTITTGGALSLHYRLPIDNNWSTHVLTQPPASSTGYQLDMDSNEHLTLSLRTTNLVHIYSLEDGENWSISSHQLDSLSSGTWDLVVTPTHYIMFTTSSTTSKLTWHSIGHGAATSSTSNWNSMEFGLLQIESNTNAAVDSNGTIHLSLWDEVNNDVEVLRIYVDQDRDHVFDLIDEFPELGNQWNDADGDGYGDNQKGPLPDSCPSTSGGSSFVIFGCADFESDGFADTIDACNQNTGTSWIDRYGCADTDLDGWSDNTFLYFFGDKYVDNWKQAIDSDGDGLGDNHGPDCCDVLFPWGETYRWDEGDLFPYLWTQWKDTDGDGFGDNDSDTIYGDYCPWDWGASWRDRNGCLDTDNDGASDPTLSGDIFEWNTTHGADVWPQDPTQWADSDGDGYGDNDSQGATNPDHFPNTIAAANDTDDDGFPDNWTEYFTPDELSDNSDGLILDDCPTVWGNSTRILFGCLDSDGDSWPNSLDDLPFEPTQSVDSDGDGFGDNPNGNLADQCINEAGVFNGTDGVGCPLIDADDDDSDGIINTRDLCPTTPVGESVNSDGCGQSQLDEDNDGVSNDNDRCPGTPASFSVDSDGCTSEQRSVDTDNDGIFDIDDDCEETPEGEEVDEYGCSESQKDSDGDGIPNNLDACDDTPEGYPILADGCTDDVTLNQGDFDGDGYSGDYTFDVDNSTGLRTNQSGDAFKADNTQWFDTDGDGYGDNQAPAKNPDACPMIWGNSSFDRLGCLDSDGDGYSNADETWVEIHGADAFELDPTQWKDKDGDGYGDNSTGNNPDLCPNTDLSYLNQVDENGCAPNERDSDNDGVLDSRDSCPNEAKGPDGFSDGCPLPKTQTDDEPTLLFGMSPASLAGIIGAAIGGIILILVIIRIVLRNKDDDENDDYDDYDDDDDDDVFAALDKKSSRSSPTTPSRGQSSPLRTPPSTSRGPSGGPSDGPSGGPTSRPPSGPRGGPTSGPAGGPPSGPSRSPGAPSQSSATTSQKVAKKRAPVAQLEDSKAKVRKARIEVDLDVFDEGQEDDRDAAVEWIVGAIAEGEIERTMLLQLQETGWTAEQSRAIINLAKNQI